jgi:hypothetical protein
MKIAIADTEGDIEAGCERVTSPVLKVVSKWEFNSTMETTNQVKVEQ